MRIIDYSPANFEALQIFANRLSVETGLGHRPFVDHYYASNPWCHLQLCVEDDGEVVASFGVEHMRFERNDEELTIGFGSNFYSLRPGVGGMLFVRWLQSVPLGLVYGGSPDTHNLLRIRRWKYFEGIKNYVLNDAYRAYPGQKWWRLAAKSMARRLLRSRLSAYARRIPKSIRGQMSVLEESHYSEDLLPRHTPFSFRFAPNVEYLRWRYNLGLSFVRYRLFRIRSEKQTVGYAILTDSPESVMVAHCDGAEPRTLAYGVWLSILEVGQDDWKPRTVHLASSHPEMQEIYESLGFRPTKQERPFALGTLSGPADLEADTSNWLVNLDWGDNGLRTPFLDQFQGSGRATKPC